VLKKLAVLALSLVFLAPTLGLITVGLVMNPAAIGYCTMPGAEISVGNVPDSLTVTTALGATFTLNTTQLTHAATIITEGATSDGVTGDGIQIALMAALTESSLRQLANTGTYPESEGFPNDGNGADHDSLGLFQMRPQAGWGTVAELMEPKYQVAAFFGGPTGPNYPSPRGLLDIPGWPTMGKGEAAQAVEVSAFADRYDNYAPVAEKILAALTGGTVSGGTVSGGTGSGGAQPILVTALTSRVVFPLPEGTWVQSADFGPRIDPINGEHRFHSGIDLAAPDGTPILAAADGTVTVAEYTNFGGGLIVIEHRIDGQTVATAYRHMWQAGIHVVVGQKVTAGQQIGDVGSSGHSTGPHLHFEVRPGGTNSDAIDPAGWLNSHHAANFPEPIGGLTACTSPNDGKLEGGAG
jgi:murein DD-endopeptidase